MDTFKEMVKIMGGQIPLTAAMKDEREHSPTVIKEEKVLILNYDKVMRSLAELLAKAKDARKFVQTDGHEYSKNTIGMEYIKKLAEAKQFLSDHKVWWKK
jgi:hypothetical protein